MEEELQEEAPPVVLTNPALADLNRIYIFHFHSYSETTADRILNEIWDGINILFRGKIFYGQREPYLDHLKREYRRIIVNNYKIIYFIGKTGIYINRVFDARQNPKKMKVR